MVLLDLLLQQPQLSLLVAHIDHGIRNNSQQDRKLVQKVCMSHNVEFVYKRLSLDKHASEEEARKYRYDFLRHVREIHHADAIITAHHQDDLLETAIINLLRGTGRRGLTSLRSHDRLVRPLLHVTKRDIIAYAKSRGIIWHEDETNTDTNYLRNHVRHNIMPKLNHKNRQKLLSIIVRHSALNKSIDAEINSWLTQNVTSTLSSTTLPCYPFIMLPQTVSYELLQTALQKITEKTVVKNVAQHALLFIKTAQPHKIFQLNKQWQLRAGKREVIVELNRA
jgi:tRNA(Ile)-lysidine synthase